MRRAFERSLKYSEFGQIIEFDHLQTFANQIMMIEMKELPIASNQKASKSKTYFKEKSFQLPPIITVTVYPNDNEPTIEIKRKFKNSLSEFKHFSEVEFRCLIELLSQELGNKLERFPSIKNLFNVDGKVVNRNLSIILGNHHPGSDHQGRAIKSGLTSAFKKLYEELLKNHATELNAIMVDDFDSLRLKSDWSKVDCRKSLKKKFEPTIDNWLRKNQDDPDVRSLGIRELKKKFKAYLNNKGLNPKEIQFRINQIKKPTVSRS